MSVKLVFLGAVFLIFSSLGNSQQPEKLEGNWRLVLAKTGGRVGLDLAPSFQTMEIRGRDITMNGDRQLKFRTDEKLEPPQIYVVNEKDGQTIRVYSGIYRFLNGDLVICVDAGDVSPKSFTAEDTEANFLLRFSRTGL